MTLKTNSKRILDVIAGQEAVNATEAYLQIHPNASNVTARNNSSQLLKKPEAQIYLQAHIDKAKAKIVKLVDSPKESISLAASQDILDRTHGKARQTTEVTSTSLSLSIDLTGDTITPSLDVAQ